MRVRESTLTEKVYQTLTGLEVPKSKACKAYADAHAVDNLKSIAQPGIRHRMTPLMVTEASDWFDQFLKQ
ncbi:hypothetical protein FF1_016957 [Malus domestica]